MEVRAKMPYGWPRNVNKIVTEDLKKRKPGPTLGDENLAEKNFPIFQSVVTA